MFRPCRKLDTPDIRWSASAQHSAEQARSQNFAQEGVIGVDMPSYVKYFTPDSYHATPIDVMLYFGRITFLSSANRIAQGVAMAPVATGPTLGYAPGTKVSTAQRRRTSGCMASRRYQRQGHFLNRKKSFSCSSKKVVLVL